MGVNDLETKLEYTYQNILRKYGFSEGADAQSVNGIVKESIQRFMNECNNPAIYCNGLHTRMLMTDFIFEMKKVKYIVDNYKEEQTEGGYRIIKDEELEQEGVDGVIISTYVYREQVLQSLSKKHETIKYLDLYAELEKKGIKLKGNYYAVGGIHAHYRTINALQRRLQEHEADAAKIYEKLLEEYVQIKDFRTAILVAQSYNKRFPSDKTEALIKDLQNIYALEKDMLANLSDENVLMFCMDGLRRKDVTQESMPKLTEGVSSKSYVYQNAYSVSTSTFESLCPAYSQNYDLRTKYYEKNTIREEECNFVMEAKKEKRQIYFYTNTDYYVESDWIQFRIEPQTATEKIWYFLLDALKEKAGLFYIHASESHFTFPNPYTMEKLLAEGMSMIYDFLPVKGQKLRADYESQHADMVRYLDDILAPLLSEIPCRMVFFADHGNLLLGKNCKLEDVSRTALTCGEEWIRIPYLVKSPEMGIGTDDDLISLMSIGDIVISLMKRQPYRQEKLPFVKVVRSRLYNPDMEKVYKMRGEERSLQAFEAFIFQEGYKLVVYEDGTAAVFRVSDDSEIEDEEITITLLERIRKYITVCEDTKL